MPDQQQVSMSDARRARVDVARAAWIRQLVDLSRRNSLLYFRDLKVGTLDITESPTESRGALLAGESEAGVPLANLVDEAGCCRAAASLQQIVDRARSNFEERGLDTLFLAVGLASWTARDGGRNADAPVLLVPIEAVQAGGRSGTWKLRRAGDISLNSVLAHALRQEHGLSLDADGLVALLEPNGEEAPDVETCFQQLAAQAAEVPGFCVKPRWVLGNFAFQKMAIVKDLERLATALAAHDLVAGIAGDPGAADLARGDRSDGDPSLPDRTPPEQEFLIRDADSSQQKAIAFTLAGRNGVISGPPGTGKSQTIANLIAEMVARGKHVLFVAEKRAALDVVLDRLRGAGLDHLCLDCHSAELTRRHIAEQMKVSLERIRDAPVPQADDIHRRFNERRDRLNSHVRSLHGRRQFGGLSVYEIYTALAGVPEVSCATRLTKKVLAGLDQSGVETCEQRLRELASLAPLVTGESSSPWVGGRITSAAQQQRAVAAVAGLAHESWTLFELALTQLLEECQLRPPSRVGDIEGLLDLVSRVEKTLSQSDADIFQLDLERLLDDLKPAASSVTALLGLLFNGRYRAALRDVRAKRRGKLNALGVVSLVGRLLGQLREWQAAAGGPNSCPRVATRLSAARSAWSECAHAVAALREVFPDKAVDDLSLNEVGVWVRLLASDRTAAAELLHVHVLGAELESRGIAPLLQELRARRPPANEWTSILRRCWLMSCLDEVHLQDPSVPAFRGRLHEQLVQEFRQLDHDRLRVAVTRVQRAHAVAAIDAMNKRRDQAALVGREANKKARHIPLRKLLAEAPDVMLALRPCWMASPLSVSQLVPGDRPLFDLVIFDEASQVLPEDAVTSLLRGHQAVIAGDSRQLPPTTFFAAGVEDALDSEDDSTEGTQGFQSILDVMSAFLEPAWSLDWHYRSRDEALIAFSNHHIYGGRLVTFPGAGGASVIKHDLVPHVRGDGAEITASREVDRVVELVLEHAAMRPSESLGVITMGIDHANKITMALARARQQRPDLDPFFDQERRERFFVKNLERVQGDERDATILSIGYAKNEAGHLVYRFGPLLQEGGERRLNVAVTRARRRTTVVSSFSHTDVQPDYPKVGVRLLRAYLEYAAANGKRLESSTVTEVPPNDFEQSIHDELTRRGMRLVRQVGSSRYRIDLAALHPEKAGRYVLAIECDGASYHSAPTARDRDRLRQEQLEALGWRFHRIWSTDWFYRRDEEVERALAAFQAAVVHADAVDARGDRPLRVVRDEPGAHVADGTPNSTSAQRHGPKPLVRPGKAIAEYRPAELVSLVRWVESDGRLRTEAELVDELVRELEFKRRGSKIVAALEAAVMRAKRRA